MYYFMFIVCVNTIASMINTNVFFDFSGTNASLEIVPNVQRGAAVYLQVRSL